MVEEIASERGVDVAAPDDFYALVADRHEGDQAGETAERGDRQRFAELPETDRLYYDDQSRMEFEAMVLEVVERDDPDGASTRWCSTRRCSTPRGRTAGRPREPLDRRPDRRGARRPAGG
jgi:alanyl-tRNA synthetase (EC 6.1.1.7)